MHIPVMTSETLELLAIRPDGVYLDATAGMGGHTSLIAAKLTTGMVIANDRDPDSLDLARGNTVEWQDRIRFHHGTFDGLRKALDEAGVGRVDGLLADLGVSRYQLTTPERGFSFQADGPLDCRMDRTTGTTAADIVNYTAEKALADLIFQYGEERRARRIARAIVRGRPIRSTLHLAGIVERAAPRTGRIHPATKTFQALRMAVNEESSQLSQLLALGPGLLAPGGRWVVISFMSIDDRQVKQKFQSLAREGRAVVLTKHPLQPSAEEIENNPASRSAKLRGVQMQME